MLPNSITSSCNSTINPQMHRPHADQGNKLELKSKSVVYAIACKLRLGDFTCRSNPSICAASSFATQTITLLLKNTAARDQKGAHASLADEAAGPWLGRSGTRPTWCEVVILCCNCSVFSSVQQEFACLNLGIRPMGCHLMNCHSGSYPSWPMGYHLMNYISGCYPSRPMGCHLMNCHSGSYPSWPMGYHLMNYISGFYPSRPMGYHLVDCVGGSHPSRPMGCHLMNCHSGSYPSWPMGYHLMNYISGSYPSRPMDYHLVDCV